MMGEAKTIAVMLALAKVLCSDTKEIIDLINAKMDVDYTPVTQDDFDPCRVMCAKMFDVWKQGAK